MDYDEIIEGLTEAHDADADYQGRYIEKDAAEIELTELLGV